MISRLGSPCLQHHKVFLGQSCALFETFTLHCQECTSPLSQAQRNGNQFLQHLTLQQIQHFLCSFLLCSSQATPHKPCRANGFPVLHVCTRLHLPSHRLCHSNNHLSKQRSWKRVRRQLITSAAKSICVGHANAVQAEFAKAGIPAEVTQKILKQYKPYLNWGIDTKLRPALQLWLQELGIEQLSVQLQKSPSLLVCKPEDCNEVYLWLVSKGVNAARVQQKAPIVMTREIGAVQSTCEALQQAAAFSDTQIQALLHKHSVALAYGPKRVLGTLQAISAMLGMPMTSGSFRQVIIAAHDRLFFMSPATLHQRVTFFCQMYATGTHVARTAFTTGVFVTSELVMQTRAEKLQEQLGWDNEQLKQKLSAEPSILNSEPSTIARNVQEMQGAGFSQTQVWAMCTLQPALLRRKWTSDTNAEKLQFLTCLLGLTLDDIVARPHLLMHSINSSLGPRVWFLYQTGAIEAPNTVMTSGLFGYMNNSKLLFSEQFSPPSAFPAMVFDSAFVDHWKQRWVFLRQHMKLSVETIAAHQDLLLTSLPDRLAPRWQLLSSIANEQAAFKAEDHLTALATLSDQDFADLLTATGELLSLNKMVGLLFYVLASGGCAHGSVSRCFLSLRCMASQVHTYVRFDLYFSSFQPGG